MNGIPESQMSEFAPDVIALIGTGAVKVIRLTKGKVAVVDAEDYEKLIIYKWQAEDHHHTFYAGRSKFYNNQNHRIRMHRVILNLSKNDTRIVDHKDRNGLNNMRNNIRIVDRKFNGHNGKFKKLNTSGYRGVSWCKQTNKWVSRIRYDGKRFILGRFTDIKSAAIAYDNAAYKKYGKNAVLNFNGDKK